MSEDQEKLASQQMLCPQEAKASRTPCCSQLKLFIVALSFAFFSKALSGTYMKSSITQIERRFDLSSSLIGLIDGGFEMGNLLFLAVVSHFGAQLHRPRLIAAGCVLMAVGSALTALPHFFMGRYKYDTLVSSLNDSITPCMEFGDQQRLSEDYMRTGAEKAKCCAQDSGSHMWVYVFLGNALRGIGETPVTPLGISYIDDFAKAENSAFYIACLQTITLLGPMFGFLLGSMCAKIYVDIGFVNTDSVTITPQDARWVGAWWLGFFVSSAVMLLAAVPFWFLPRSLPKQGEEGKDLPDPQERSAPPEAQPHSSDTTKLADIAKGFFPSLRKLLCTPAYFLLLCGSVLKFNSFIGLLTFKAKYMEQQFGQSASRANFLIGECVPLRLTGATRSAHPPSPSPCVPAGVTNLPAVAVGIFLGGVLMKRYKLSVVGGAQLSLVTSLAAYLLVITQFGIKCANLKVAGLTISYNGTPGVSPDGVLLLSPCNEGCSCPTSEWDPVCSDNGITYTSPCLAGCTGSSGSGKNTVFHNCTCVKLSPPLSGSLSVSLGQCPRSESCTSSFTAYMAVSVLSSFINSLGATPGYMVIIRCITPELKSLALGIQTLVMRTLGGIPAPVYFGAFIDLTCLKWGTKKCGGRGACRLYDSDMYRLVFLGLITGLSGSSYFFIIAVIVLLKKQFRQEEEGRGADGDPTQGDFELEHPQAEKAAGPPEHRRRQQQDRALEDRPAEQTEDGEVAAEREQTQAGDRVRQANGQPGKVRDGTAVGRRESEARGAAEGDAQSRSTQERHQEQQ
ncbi:solute carrier organic anion transporter family member 1C1-like [Arapaima gigas]